MSAFDDEAAQGRQEEADAGVAGILERLGPPQLVRDQALETIKSAIISGRLKPGARLKDREMCEALGVSRTIVREVIRELAAEKLVEITAHRGPRVARLTPKMAREIYDMRAELEVMLVRAFIENAPQESLRPLMAEVEDAARRSDLHGLVAIMRRFNEHLIKGADNDVLADILRSLLARISWLRVTSMTEPDRIARSVEEIRRVVESVENGDAPAAEQAVRAYVTAARDAALRQLTAAQGDTDAPQEVRSALS